MGAGARPARLFAAVELPPHLTAELERWTRHSLPAAEGVRRLSAGSLHLTLVFLGAQALADVDAIADALRASATPVGTLELGAPLWLPPRRPTVLAVAVGDAEGALAQLHRSVSLSLRGAIGWVPERSRFRPHITVARLRTAPPGSRELPPTPAISFTPEELTLYRSHLDPAGARYEALVSVGLPLV